MHILGHRGAMAHKPENTLSGIRHALSDVRVAGVEFDVRLSADGTPMVFHDRDLERLTGRPGVFEETDDATLGERTVGGEAIPTLEATVAVWRSLRPQPAPRTFNVELKPTGNYDALVAACRPLLDPMAGPERDATPLIVSSFDPRVLRSAQRQGAPWRLALLFEDRRELEALRFLDRPHEVDLHPHYSLLDQESASQWAATHRDIRCWTVNDPNEAIRLRDLGCAAVICNSPTGMADALGA